MLRVLELREFVLAREVRLDLAPGLNVLTGETGAGKSLLVDALGLLTGVRAEAGLIRRGAQRALVQAEFDTCTASRSLVLEGRNTARLDGELVTVAELSDTVGERIAVFAQHAQQALLSPAAQRAALDRLLDEDGATALTSWSSAWNERRTMLEELESLREASSLRKARIEAIDVQLAEIDAANLEIGEEDSLSDEARRLRHGERIEHHVALASRALDGDESAVTALATARRALREVAGYDDALAALLVDVEAALHGAQAVASELDAMTGRFDADPLRLDAVEARLAVLQRLFAKYGDGSHGVLAYRATLAAELEATQASDARIEALELSLEALETRMTDLAATLHASRARAAEQLREQVAPFLERLAMQGATLDPVVESAPWGPYGANRIRLDFAANAGEPVAALAQAASGGELSRVMLAVWLVTGSDRTTLVFDEVDAGVGGRAASAVGELLAELAHHHQVLVVTHLAQVAAHADHHVHVGKRTEEDRTASVVSVLGEEARVRELARMLAGHDDAPAVDAARDLVARASARKRVGA